MVGEPVVSIGAIFTSLKLAVVSIITVIAISMQWDEAMTGAVIGAGSAITLAVGDIIAAYLTRGQVTPVAQPSLPVGAAVNEFGNAPSTVVADAE